MTTQQLVQACQQAASSAAASANQALAALQQMQSGSGVSSSAQTADFIPTTLCLPFIYPFTIQLTANALGQGTIQMAADSTFELFRVLGNSTADVASNVTQNNFALQFQDQSSGRYLSSSLIPQSIAVTSSYQFGNDQKYPVRFPANQIIGVQVQNLTQAPIQVNIFLSGYKFFQIAPSSSNKAS